MNCRSNVLRVTKGHGETRNSATEFDTPFDRLGCSGGNGNCRIASPNMLNRNAIAIDRRQREVASACLLAAGHFDAHWTPETTFVMSLNAHRDSLNVRSGLRVGAD